MIYVSYHFCRRLLWSVYLKREVARLIDPMCNPFLMMYHFTMFNSHIDILQITPTAWNNCYIIFNQVTRSVRHSRPKGCEIVCGTDWLLPRHDPSFWNELLSNWSNGWVFNTELFFPFIPYSSHSFHGEFMCTTAQFQDLSCIIVCATHSIIWHQSRCR